MPVPSEKLPAITKGQKTARRFVPESEVERVVDEVSARIREQSNAMLSEQAAAAHLLKYKAKKSRRLNAHLRLQNDKLKQGIEDEKLKFKKLKEALRIRTQQYDELRLAQLDMENKIAKLESQRDSLKRKLEVAVKAAPQLEDGAAPLQLHGGGPHGKHGGALLDAPSRSRKPRDSSTRRPRPASGPAGNGGRREAGVAAPRAATAHTKRQPTNTGAYAYRPSSAPDADDDGSRVREVPFEVGGGPGFESRPSTVQTAMDSSEDEESRGLGPPTFGTTRFAERPGTVDSSGQEGGGTTDEEGGAEHPQSRERIYVHGGGGGRGRDGGGSSEDEDEDAEQGAQDDEGDEGRGAHDGRRHGGFYADGSEAGEAYDDFDEGAVPDHADFPPRPDSRDDRGDGFGGSFGSSSVSNRRGARPHHPQGAPLRPASSPLRRGGGAGGGGAPPLHGGPASAGLQLQHSAGGAGHDLHGGGGDGRGSPGGGMMMRMEEGGDPGGPMGGSPGGGNWQRPSTAPEAMPRGGFHREQHFEEQQQQQYDDHAAAAAAGHQQPQYSMDDDEIADILHDGEPQGGEKQDAGGEDDKPLTKAARKRKQFFKRQPKKRDHASAAVEEARRKKEEADAKEAMRLAGLKRTWLRAIMYEPSDEVRRRPPPRPLCCFVCVSCMCASPLCGALAHGCISPTPGMFLPAHSFPQTRTGRGPSLVQETAKLAPHRRLPGVSLPAGSGAPQLLRIDCRGGWLHRNRPRLRCQPALWILHRRGRVWGHFDGVIILLWAVLRDRCRQRADV